MNELSTRIHFMDSMRSVLMILGVALHSSNVFNTKQNWLMYSQNTTVIADYVGQVIHVFRMPTFFMISGFFCTLSLRKYKPAEFLAVRAKRIVIPLIFTAVTLNYLQTVILNGAGFQQYNLETYLLEGGWVSHLWFLNNLIVYFALAFILASFFMAPVQIAGNYLGRIFMSVPLGGIVLLLPTVSIIILGLNELYVPENYVFQETIRANIMLKYLPYFIFGCVLGGRHKLLYKFSKMSPFFSLLLIAISFFFMQFTTQMSVNVQRVVSVYLETLIAWVSVSLCFFVFFNLADRPSKKWLFLSDASYTMYLFHHVLVIAIGLWLIKLEIHPVVNMFLLMSVTTLITIYIHKYCILKSRYARLLFNGK